MTPPDFARPLHLHPLEPQYRARVWGGRKLRASDPPTGEAWIAHGDSRVSGGPHAGRTLRELAEEDAAAFLGEDVARRFGTRFPLLVKLLDCADWLSVQVHPDDAQAARLVGPGASGKTEAWAFLEADAGAEILAGVRPGTTGDVLARAIRAGRVLDVAARRAVRAGESVFVPAGTLHALGPGLLLYEVQQASDTTYRVYDWDRPAGDGRALHVEEAVAVTNPDLGPTVGPPPPDAPGAHRVVTCPFFALDALHVGPAPLHADTAGRSAHVLTVTRGEAEVARGGEVARLARFDTLLVAGNAGTYEVRSRGGPTRLLRVHVPADPA